LSQTINIDTQQQNNN